MNLLLLLLPIHRDVDKYWLNGCYTAAICYLLSGSKAQHNGSMFNPLIAFIFCQSHSTTPHGKNSSVDGSIRLFVQFSVTESPKTADERLRGGVVVRGGPLQALLGQTPLHQPPLRALLRAVPGTQFNRNFSGSSFGLKNLVKNGLRFHFDSVTCLNYPFFGAPD